MKCQITYYKCDRCGQRIENCHDPKLMGERKQSSEFTHRDLKVQGFDYDEEGGLELRPLDFCKNCYNELQAWMERKDMDKFMTEATMETKKGEGYECQHS